jgi:hypothetical protein
MPEWVDHALVNSDFSKAASLIWDTLHAADGQASLSFDSSGKIIVPANIEPLIVQLLPTNRQELQQMGAAVNSKKELSYYLAEHKGLSSRSPDWIETHGLCLENILPSQSTLPFAGQGAFAQYPIQKGEIVMPAPLLQIMDRKALELYDKDTGMRLNDQLLLNYCFAHSQSSLLLCPDTQATLINHCSMRTRECGKNGPNASIRWASGWDPTSDAWRQMSLEELSQQKGRGLAFEVYALRDIQPGEEIFFDYGIEFENSWKTHVRDWKPRQRPEDWISATQANAETKRILPQFISGDLRKHVEHPYLFLGCQFHKSEMDASFVYAKPNKHWRNLTDTEILSSYSENGSSFSYRYKDLGYAKHADISHWPCSVLLEEDKPGTYTVQIHQNQWERPTSWHKNDLPRILTGYKRSSLHYFVRPYKSDQQMEGAFRHPLGIPDDMFPEQWKNLK